MKGIKQQPILETPRLVLRPFTMEDAPAVQRLAGAREVAATMLAIPHPYEDGVAEQWISTHQEAFERAQQVHFAVVPQHSLALCGSISLVINQQDNNATLGYWIGLPYWGQGYATEAAQAIVHYGFTVLKLHRIHARCFSSNAASGRVLQKVGMVYEGCLREHIFKGGQFHDVEHYGLLAREWLAK
jgi:[ribosomal protein S5]-alanine N-acetyltransferase